MHWSGWIVVVLALNVGGWFAFDGGRALVKGDYVTPKTGRYAGQLGTWSRFIRVIGIDPRSTLMKTIFLAYGGLWLIVIACFIFQVSWAWWAMLVAAIGSLWYWPFGTMLDVLQIILLLMPSLRAVGTAAGAE